MAKQLISKYSFNAAARTITCTDFENMTIDRFLLVTNSVRNLIMYNFADPTKNGSVSGNVLTLDYNTTAMANNEALAIFYDARSSDPQTERTIVGNARTKFRDGFGSGAEAAVWDMSAGNHLITEGGNSMGASYLRVSLDPFAAGEFTLTSKKSFRYPLKLGVGLSISQRFVGQETFMGVVGCDNAGALEYAVPATTSWPITGSTAVANGATLIYTCAGHGLVSGDRVIITGCTDSRINLGPLPVIVQDKNSFYFSSVYNGSFTSTGGTVSLADPLKFANNAVGNLFENATVTNASFVSRRGGDKFRSLNVTCSSTTGSQLNTGPYADAWSSQAVFEIYGSLDEIQSRSFTADSLGSTNVSKYVQGIPDEEKDYKIHFRTANLANFTRPVARVVTAVKSGGTTATITTDVPHGLNNFDFVGIWGCKDQTNFAGQGTGLQVSVVSSTVFQVALGNAVTASTVAGVVYRVNGSNPVPGALATAANTMARVNGVLSVTCWVGPALLPGEYVNLYGLEPSAVAWEGVYKVLRVSGVYLELENPGNDVGTFSCGGAIIKRTDVRLHFARMMDYTRHVVEVDGGRGGTTDVNRSVPVSVTGSATVGVSQGTGANTVQWSAAGYSGFVVSDVLSAAITVSTTSATIIPGTVATVGTYSHSFYLGVTAIATVTLDVGIEESADNGTTWVRVYDFERISAVGSYYSPQIRSIYGSRFRYVQTVVGTGSVTRGINRLMYSTPGTFLRRFIDRTIVVGTQFSKTPAYLVEGCDSFVMDVNMGGITTTAPQILLQGSETQDSTDWYSLGSGIALTAVANTSIRFTATGELPKYVRALVTTAGSGATLNYVVIKALGR